MVFAGRVGSNGIPSTIKSSITALPELPTDTLTLTPVALSIMKPVTSGMKNVSPSDLVLERFSAISKS